LVVCFFTTDGFLVVAFLTTVFLFNTLAAGLRRAGADFPLEVGFATLERALVFERAIMMGYFTIPPPDEQLPGKVLLWLEVRP
jgi:hypothetical protein